MRSAALIAIACTIACGSTRQSNLVETAPQPPATVFAAGDGVDVRLSSSGRTIEDVVFAKGELEKIIIRQLAEHTDE